MLNSEVPCVWYLIGRIVKTYDYINHVVITLPLSVYEDTWTHSPLSLLCITMILRVRRNFFKLLLSPIVVSEPDLCEDVICTSRTQVSCGRYKSYCLPACHTLVRRYCAMKRSGPTLRVCLRETGFTAVLCTQVTSGCQFLQL